MTDSSIAPASATEGLDALDRPAGPAAAAILATGIGAFVLGLLTTLNEASTDIHDFLELDKEVGPLSGKTTFAVVAYVVAWGVLHGVWRRQSPPLRPILILTAILIGLGILGTFPTFFVAFAPE
jgi:hypothetical protein